MRNPCTKCICGGCDNADNDIHEPIPCDNEGNMWPGYEDWKAPCCIGCHEHECRREEPVLHCNEYKPVAKRYW